MKSFNFDKKGRVPVSDRILFILMSLIIVILFAQVLFRYVFNQSLSWSEELAKFIFVWLTFLGAAVCIKDRLHIGVEFLVERLPENRKKYLELFRTALTTVFNGALSVIGFCWVREVSGTLSPAMSLPLNLVFYAALPVAAVLSVVYGTKQFIEELRKVKMSNPITPE
jgi:TRAP-type C4-dicarboxylate transport system permease small subunit